jgi:hypothetical protein
VVDALLRSLPEWSGIEASIVDYVESARHLPTYLAFPAAGTSDEPAGVLLAARHFLGAAGIYLMAADRSAHRSGIGLAGPAGPAGQIAPPASPAPPGRWHRQPQRGNTRTPLAPPAPCVAGTWP